MRVKNEKKNIPKLPPMELVSKQLNANAKNEKLHNKFEKDEKLSIDNLLAGPKNQHGKRIRQRIGTFSRQISKCKRNKYDRVYSQIRSAKRQKSNLCQHGL